MSFTVCEEKSFWWVWGKLGLVGFDGTFNSLTQTLACLKPTKKFCGLLFDSEGSFTLEMSSMTSEIKKKLIVGYSFTISSDFSFLRTTNFGSISLPIDVLFNKDSFGTPEAVITSRLLPPKQVSSPTDHSHLNTKAVVPWVSYPQTVPVKVGPY